MLLESYLSLTIIFLAIGIGLSSFELISSQRILAIEKPASTGKTMTASLFYSLFQQFISNQNSRLVILTRIIGAIGLIASVTIVSETLLSISLAIVVCSYSLSPFELNISNHTYLLTSLLLFVCCIINVEWVSIFVIWAVAILPLLGYITNGFTTLHRTYSPIHILPVIALILFWIVPLPYSWFALGIAALFYLIIAINKGLITFYWLLLASYPFLIYCRLLIN